MDRPRRKFLRLAVGAAALPAFSRLVMAQGYPAQSVRLVVTSAAVTAFVFMAVSLCKAHTARPPPIFT